jgi:hypothetical protein
VKTGKGYDLSSRKKRENFIEEDGIRQTSISRKVSQLQELKKTTLAGQNAEEVSFREPQENNKRFNNNAEQCWNSDFLQNCSQVSFCVLF